MRLIKRLIVLVALVAIFSASLGAAALAGSTEYDIKSQSYTRLEDDSGWFLQGNVQITTVDFQILADEVTYDEVNKIFTALGPGGTVLLRMSDKTIHCESLLYRVREGYFDLSKPSGVLGEFNGEKVYFKGRRLFGTQDVFKITKGEITTCEPGCRQEYHIKSRTMKYLSNRKIIMKSSWFYGLKFPMLWFPYYQFSMKTVPYEIRVGKNKSDGYYVNAKYTYVATEMVLGTLLYDWYEKRGNRYGTQVYYDWKNVGPGDLYFSYFSDREEDATDTNIDWRQEFLLSDELRGDVDLSQIQETNEYSGRTEKFSFKTDWNYRTNSTQLTTDFSFTDDKREGSTSSTGSSLRANLRYTRRWQKSGYSLTITDNFTDQERKDTHEDVPEEEQDELKHDQALTQTVSVQQRGNKITWSLDYKDQYDIDGDSYLNDERSTYSKVVPEAKLSLRNTLWGGRNSKIPIDSIDFRLKNFESSSEDALFGEYKVKTSYNIKKGKKRSLRYTGTFTQTLSDTHEAWHDYSPRLTFTNKYMGAGDKSLDDSWSYTYSTSRGGHPEKSTSNSARERSTLTYQLKYRVGRRTNAQLSSGYNFDKNSRTRKRIQPIKFTYSTWPTTRARLNFTTGYDFNDEDFSPLQGQLNWGNNKSLDTSFRFNIDVQGGFALDELTNITRMQLNDGWSANIETGYKRVTSGDNDLLRRVYLYKRNCCTYMQLAYTASNDDLSFTVGITALPAAKLGVGSDGFASPFGFDNFSFSGDPRQSRF